MPRDRAINTSTLVVICHCHLVHLKSPCYSLQFMFEPQDYPQSLGRSVPSHTAVRTLIGTVVSQVSLKPACQWPAINRSCHAAVYGCEVECVNMSRNWQYHAARLLLPLTLQSRRFHWLFVIAKVNCFFLSSATSQRALVCKWLCRLQNTSVIPQRLRSKSNYYYEMWQGLMFPFTACHKWLFNKMKRVHIRYPAIPVVLGLLVSLSHI